MRERERERERERVERLFQLQKTKNQLISTKETQETKYDFARKQVGERKVNTDNTPISELVQRSPQIDSLV